MRNDDDLVARAKSGDPEAWRSLYRDHAGRLLAWLRTRPTGDSAASADDVAAEAWYLAASKIGEFSGSSTDFAGWLFGIARKVGAGVKRTADRRGTQPSEAASELGRVDDHTLVYEHADWVRDTISVLPPRERDAVALVDGLGLDVSSAAKVLGVRTATLRVARHRGLRRLQQSMRSSNESVGDVTPGGSHGM